MSRWNRTWFVAISLLLTFVPPVSAESSRVLILNSFGNEFSPYGEYIVNLRADLARQSPEPLDLYEVSLSAARFAEGDREEPFVQYLHSLFADRQLHLVITVGAPAAGFAQRYRQRLFASTPMLFTAVDARRLDDSALTPNDATVSVAIDLPAVIANILTVLPETKRIAVVIGNSPLERFWLEEARRQFRQFANRVEFIWFNDIPFAEMLKRAATLPPQSALFFGLLAVDATGVPLQDHRALTAIHGVASAPMFSYVDAHFARGIVGGPLINLGEVSRRAASVALRILDGESPGNFRMTPVGMGTPMFDWRELDRWHIDDARLPQGSIVLHRAPTLWDQYKWYIASTLAVGILQAVFIVVLLMNHQRLRRAYSARARAEDAVHELAGRLINAHEEERSRLARELHDDVTQRLALLAIDAGCEERNPSGPAGANAMRAMREGLVRLSEDVHALSYRLHPSILEDLGLLEALKSECDRFSRTCPVRLQANPQDIPGELSPEVALCVFRIAQEALRNVARHARASGVEVCLQPLEGGLELIVNDNGAGFDGTQLRSGISLGLASMRQRAFHLGGKIDVISSPGRGTTIRAWIPLRGEHCEPSARAAG